MSRDTLILLAVAIGFIGLMVYLDAPLRALL